MYDILRNRSPPESQSSTVIQLRKSAESDNWEHLNIHWRWGCDALLICLRKSSCASANPLHEENRTGQLTMITGAWRLAVLDCPWLSCITLKVPPCADHPLLLLPQDDADSHRRLRRAFQIRYCGQMEETVVLCAVFIFTNLNNFSNPATPYPWFGMPLMSLDATLVLFSGRSHLCDGGMALPPQTSSFTVCKGAPLLGPDGGILIFLRIFGFFVDPIGNQLVIWQW